MAGITSPTSNSWDAGSVNFGSFLPAVAITAMISCAVPVKDGTSYVTTNQTKHGENYSQNFTINRGGGEKEGLEVSMSNISREELDAKLSRNKAESESIAAAMTTEMAQFRTSYVESFSEISKTLSRIESKADATEKRLTQAQWIISAVIALCALTISISLNIAGRNNTHIAPQPAASPITINTGETKPPTVVDASPKKANQ